MTKRTTQAQAENLFTGVLEGWITLAEGLADIIERKAWKKLGYPTFVEAWRARFADLSLSVRALTPVVYAMLDDGSSAEDITVVDGMTIEGVESLIRQRNNGLPADAASPYRRGQRPRNPQTTIFIHVGANKFAEYENLARLSDRTVTAIASKPWSKHSRTSKPA